jgi:hypothetical protein
MGALLAFTLAIVLARDATRLIGSTETDDVTSPAEWVLVGLIVVVVRFLSLSGGPEAELRPGSAGGAARGADRRGLAGGRRIALHRSG